MLRPVRGALRVDTDIRGPASRLGALLAALLLAGVAAAVPPDESAGPPSVPPDDDGLPPAIERPDFVRNRPLIPDLLLKDKREGRYITGIPAVGFDAEEGFNIGAFIEIFDNGPRDHPLFRTAPYKEKIFFGGQVSTEDVVRILFRYDRPYVADTPYRIRLDALFETSEINNYFGLGDRSLDLISPRSGVRFRQYDNYQVDLDVFLQPGEDNCPASQPFLCHNSRFNKFASTEFFLVAAVERDMLGGVLRPLLGLQLHYIDVDDFTGRYKPRFSRSGSGLQLPTQLFVDCGFRRIRGCNGGWNNALRLGLTYDTRDFEPNPGRGILAQAVLSIASKIFGNASDYQRLTLSGAAFYDFLKEVDTDQQLIGAGQISYNMLFGDAPFYALPTMNFTDFDRSGLGGFSTLRGYKRNRFRGDSAVLVQSELRWFFTTWRPFGQHLRPGLAVFADAGRAFDDVDLQFKNWKVGAGVGFRLAWNLATMVSFDYGVSQEDSIFYMELGTSF